MTELFDNAGRFREVIVGIALIGISAFFAFFGLKGVWLYTHGVRTAPADPIAASIGVVGSIGAVYAATRLLANRDPDRPLLPGVVLPALSLAALAGGIWSYSIARSLHQSLGQQIRAPLLFSIVGIAGFVLWWRRMRDPRSKRAPR